MSITAAAYHAHIVIFDEQLGIASINTLAARDSGIA